MKLKYILSIVVLVFFIGYFFIKIYKRNVAKKELKKVLEQDANVDLSENIKNIKNSISKSKVLYKSLIKKIHPDKFQEEEIKEKATLLSQRITKSKIGRAHV